MRMEPLKTSSPRLVVAPSKPTVEVRQAEVEAPAEDAEPREVPAPGERASRMWWIVGAVATILLGLLAVILFVER